MNQSKNRNIIENTHDSLRVIINAQILSGGAKVSAAVEKGDLFANIA